MAIFRGVRSEIICVFDLNVFDTPVFDVIHENCHHLFTCISDLTVPVVRCIQLVFGISQSFKLQVKLSAFALRIIAMEIYATFSSKLNENFKKSVKNVFTSERLMYWSKRVREGVERTAKEGDQFLCDKSSLPDSPKTVTDTPSLNLLLAWKNFLIVTSRFKIAEIQQTHKNCGDMLNDLLCGIQVSLK